MEADKPTKPDGVVANAAAVAAFWLRAAEAMGLPATQPAPEAWAFGDSPEMADALLAPVLEGKKIATAGALWDYESEQEALPVPGDLSIVLDGAGNPRCVVETTHVEQRPFAAVDKAHAYDEGEGDRTLAWWREAHESFFTRFLPTIGHAFAPDMPLVLERFIVRYKPDEA